MNAAGSPAPSRVTIDRLDCQCLVARSTPGPAELRARLDRVVRSRLAKACGRKIEAALDAGDPAVWVIHRLEIDLALDAGALDDDHLAQVFAEALAGAILQVLGRGRSPQGATGGPEAAALRFPSRAAYLARFISDLASGTAWGRWYYESFESLRSLPDGLALAEALAREPEQAGEALRLAKQDGALERIVAALGEAGARKVLHALRPAEAAVPGGRPSPAKARRMLAALAEAWPRAWAALRSAGGEEAGSRAALLLWVEAPQAAVDGAWAVETFLQLVRAAKASPDLAGWARRLAASPGRLPDKAGAPASPELLALSRRLSAGDAEWLAQLAEAAVGFRPPAGTQAEKEGFPGWAALARSAAGEPALAAWAGFPTPFASAFLLLPALLDLDTAGLAGGLPETNITGLDPPALLRYLVLVKCFGRPRAGLAAADPALLLATGLESQPPAGAVAEYSRSLARGPAQDLQARLVSRLLELRWAEGQRLVADLVQTPLASPASPGPAEGGSPEEVLLLLWDAAHGFWLHAELAHLSGLRAALGDGLAWATSSHSLLSVLLRVESLAGESDPRLLAEICLAGEALALPGAFVLPGGPLPPGMDEFAAHLRPAGPDLAYFSLLGLEALPLENPDFDLACSLVAAAVLRSFARRLLGFHWNSAEYLYQNFLVGTGSVVPSTEEVEVRLPRPPLHLVLRMTGVDGKTLRAPWLGDRPVTLLLSEGSG